jgi:hypothetical protein
LGGKTLPISYKEFPMEIPFAVIADGANVSREGKLNILGIFDTIHARSFPVTHAEMKLVLRVVAAPDEAGMEHAIEIKLLDDEGGAVLGMKANVVPRSVPEGKPLRLDQVVSMHNVTFKKPGKYHFSIMVDGDQKAALPLTVNEAPVRGGPQPGPEGVDPSSEGPQYH